MKKYILKEYGSWGVMVMACLASLFAGVGFSLKTIISLIALSLFINSKQAFTLWIRHVDSVKSAAIFIAQVSMALLIMMGILGEAIVKLLPYALIPAAYIMLLYFAGEHAIVTEICGFALLALSSLVAKFANTNVIDNRLYAAFAVFAYYLIQMSVIILLPLIDNAIFSLTLYKLKLKATGWLEVLKGMAFLVLIAIFL